MLSHVCFLALLSEALVIKKKKKKKLVKGGESNLNIQLQYFPFKQVLF